MIEDENVPNENEFDNIDINPPRFEDDSAQTNGDVCSVNISFTFILISINIRYLLRKVTKSTQLSIKPFISLRCDLRYV